MAGGEPADEGVDTAGEAIFAKRQMNLGTEDEGLKGRKHVMYVRKD